MPLIGYARVSTEDQTALPQVQELRSAGCVEIVEEQASGGSRTRPVLARVLDQLRIGDTLTEGEALDFRGVPSFAPEILRHIRLDDPMLAKKLRTALDLLAEEGVVQLFRPRDGSPPVVGVVGQLQLDVLQSRLKVEYGVPAGFDGTPWEQVRWMVSDEAGALDRIA